MKARPGEGTQKTNVYLLFNNNQIGGDVCSIYNFEMKT